MVCDGLQTFHKAEYDTQGFVYQQRRTRWICKYIDCYMWNVITNPRTNVILLQCIYVLVFYGPGHYVQPRVGPETYFTYLDEGKVHADIVHPSMTTGPVGELCLTRIYKMMSNKIYGVEFVTMFDHIN